MWELDYKESWVLKNWCFWTVVLEKILESPLGCKENQLSILKEISPEYSLEGLRLKLKLQYFGHLMWRTDSFDESVDAGKDWRQEKKGMTEDDMVWWHHQLNGHEFEQALGIGDGQGSLACCSPQGHKELDTTEQLSWIELGDPQTGNNNTKEVGSLLWRFWAPHQAAQPGVQQRDWESPGNLTLKVSRIWLQDFHRTGGNRLHSWRTQTRSCMHQDPGERSSDLTEDWTRPKCWCWRVSYGGVGQQWLATGMRALTEAVLEGAPWNKSPWRSPLTLP